MRVDLEQRIAEASRWAKETRAMHRKNGSPLDAEIAVEFRHYFLPELVESVRLVLVPSIPMPPFLAGDPAGLALWDTILLRQGVERSEAFRTILFHEMVHLVQFQSLGSIERFTAAYLQGWLENGRAYDSIPLEVEATVYQQRYALETDAFDVEAAMNASRTSPTSEP